MNESVLFWIIVVLAFVAGIGMIPTVQMFRPHPGNRARPSWPHKPALTTDREDPLGVRPRSLHHEYDTLDVLHEGMRLGRGEHLPFPPADDSLGWVSGPMGGNAGTWRPRPYAVPSGGE